MSLQTLIAARADARRLRLGGGAPALASRSGSHLSPLLGPGAEYEQSRVYVPGDDIRHMDWRVTARARRAHVKVYRDERERPLWLLVDQGPSMRFATRVAFKSVIAARAAALLGWAGVEHGDRVGGLVFDEASRSELRPATRSRGLLPLLRALSVPSSGRGDGGFSGLAGAAQRLMCLVRPGSLIYLISDFHGIDEQSSGWVSGLAQHNELVLVAIHDPIEAQAPPAGRYPVLARGGDRRTLDTASAGRRALYERPFQRRAALLRELTRRPGVHLLHLRTDLPVARSLARGLGRHDPVLRP